MLRWKGWLGERTGGTNHKVDRVDVRDKQRGQVVGGDRVGGARFPRHCRKVDLSGVVIVEDDVDRPHEIESTDEQPKERPYPDGAKRQEGEHPSCEVVISGERAEGRRQMGADDAEKDENKPEQAE